MKPASSAGRVPGSRWLRTWMRPAVPWRAENDSMNALAERYVKLVLALGQHDADYVDAYYGPAAMAEGGGICQANAGRDRSRTRPQCSSSRWPRRRRPLGGGGAVASGTST